ncbi:MAG: glycoside hydrolase family 57 protein [Bacteroidota bacterium]
MAKICFYFQLHQPLRIRPFSIFEIGTHTPYFDQAENRRILEKVSRNSYRPFLSILEALRRDPDIDFKLAFSLSGLLIEQLEAWQNDIVERLNGLAKSGAAEFLSETYYHSLAFEFSREEFRRQIHMHAEKIRDLFEQEPKVFRNTELLFHNPMAYFLKKEGFKGQIIEGAAHVMQGRSSNRLYHAMHLPDYTLITRNFALSDDLAFRFSDKNWEHYPLTVERFADLIDQQDGKHLCIAMDFESFGEHQSAETGIFEFFKALPKELKARGHEFVFPSELMELEKAQDSIDVYHPVSWADQEKDASAWMGSPRQKEALRKVYELEGIVKESQDQGHLQTWSYLQCSDHFYYMADKEGSDQQVHQHFNPFESEQKAYMHFMNLVADFQISLREI